MKPYLLLFTLTFLIQGCADIISATREEPIENDPGNRSLGNYVDDQIIETKALVNIRKADPALENAHIEVVSFNGIVLLVGQVGSPELRKLAANTAARVEEVRKVHNELTVNGKTSMLVRSNDTWISTKVKSKLALDERTSASRIKVVTEDSVVFLMGLVSPAEADTAAGLASEIGGVQKVVRVFEYIR